MRGKGEGVRGVGQLKEKIQEIRKLNWNSQRSRRVQIKKTLCGISMDIF